MSRNTYIQYADGTPHIEVNLDPKITKGGPENRKPKQLIVFGWDGPTNEFFLQVYDYKKRDDYPIWDSTMNIAHWLPGTFQTPESVIEAAEKAGYKFDPLARTTMIARMNKDKADWRDLRTPAMKNFQQEMFDILAEAVKAKGDAENNATE